MKNKRLVVADLSPVHIAHTSYQAEAALSNISFDFSGHHSDIFFPELYNLLLAFFYKG
jgi:hypothetical protein